eukprot:356001-Amphidinium_carterae.1
MYVCSYGHKPYPNQSLTLPNRQSGKPYSQIGARVRVTFLFLYGTCAKHSPNNLLKRAHISAYGNNFKFATLSFYRVTCGTHLLDNEVRGCATSKLPVQNARLALPSEPNG